jgi:hypothetical protein
LMMKATLAEARGFVGRGEFIISRFFPKQSMIWSSRV